MKKFKLLLALTLVAGTLVTSSFKPKEEPASTAILNYAWYTPDGQFVAWSTLVNAEFVTGGNTNPTGGTLISEGYTGGGEGESPVGTPVYKLYSHP